MHGKYAVRRGSQGSQGGSQGKRPRITRPFLQHQACQLGKPKQGLHCWHTCTYKDGSSLRMRSSNWYKYASSLPTKQLVQVGTQWFQGGSWEGSRNPGKDLILLSKDPLRRQPIEGSSNGYCSRRLITESSSLPRLRDLIMVTFP